MGQVFQFSLENKIKINDETKRLATLFDKLFAYQGTDNFHLLDLVAAQVQMSQLSAADEVVEAVRDAVVAEFELYKEIPFDYNLQAR
jgi:hypothetical protein